MLQGVRGCLGTGITPYIFRAINSALLPLRATAFVLLVLASTGRADTLWLENGDTISGEILSLDGGTLKIQTEYAGTVEVDWRGVSSVDSSQELWVRLVGEEQPRLRTLKALKTGVEVHGVDHDEIKRFSLVWAVAGISQEKPVIADRWQFGGEVMVGIDSKMGNTNRAIYSFDGELKLDDEWNKNSLEWDFETKHYSSDQVEEWRVAYAYDRFFNERFYIASSFSLGYEQGADYRRRGLTGIAPGYRFWETSEGKLQTSFGLSYLWERYRKNPNQNDLGFSWQINYKTLLWKNLSYYNNNKLLYRFGSGEMLLDMRHGFIASLNSRVSLRFSHILDYDSQALTSVKEFDSQIKVSIGYRW